MTFSFPAIISHELTLKIIFGTFATRKKILQAHTDMKLSQFKPFKLCRNIVGTSDLLSVITLQPESFKQPQYLKKYFYNFHVVL